MSPIFHVHTWSGPMIKLVAQDRKHLDDLVSTNFNMYNGSIVHRMLFPEYEEIYGSARDYNISVIVISILIAVLCVIAVRYGSLKQNYKFIS